MVMNNLIIKAPPKNQQKTFQQHKIKTFAANLSFLGKEQKMLADMFEL